MPIIFRLFDCFHTWFWLMPLSIDLEGNVRWICYRCGDTIKAEIGTVPAWGSDGAGLAAT